MPSKADLGEIDKGVKSRPGGQKVKEGSGGYHQDDVKHASAGKEKKDEAQEKMGGQHQG